MGSKVVSGLERLLEQEIDRVAGKRIGLIANPTTVDRSLRHAIDLLHGRPEMELAVLFGPEHGLRSTAQDLIEVSDATDARTGLPIRSLYGPTRVPTKEMLAGLDAVVFDIQDVGSRYYTYVWTMAHAMEACARDGIEVIVLDRPNPIGGHLVEGNLIEASHLSFVG
ncbi:MAG: exo-beta-N-acetylmuramidase NamZ domain-containing protein, partial [Vicinamibacteria bacterium]